VIPCRTFTKPDVASDHNLVMAGIGVKLKTIHREKLGKKFDIERLDDNLVRGKYSTLLKSKWEQTKEKNRDSVEETWEDIRSIYTEVTQQVLGTKKGRKQKPWISPEVLRMSDQRRAMKTTKTHSEESRKRYNKLTREIKRNGKAIQGAMARREMPGNRGQCKQARHQQVIPDGKGNLWQCEHYNGCDKR